MLAPGIAYLSQLMLCSAFVILADVTHRSAWVEYLTAHRATNGVFHGSPQMRGIDLPFCFCRPTQVTPRSPGLLYQTL